MNAEELLSQLLPSRPSPAMPAGLHKVLLRLLARGYPVTVEDLAEAVGAPTDQVRQAVADQPDTELDEQGRIVGHGLTLRPTAHRFMVEGNQLYTWCALDTLIFPALLGRRAEVESSCKTTGVQVRLVVEPERLASVDPPTAAISIVIPENPASVRAAFCNQVHFFASAQAAQPWLDQHRDSRVLPIAEAHRLAVLISERLSGAE